MAKKQTHKTATGRSGVAAVELAILVPLLTLLFVIAIDYARVFYFTLVVTNCARSGALYGSQNPNTAVDQDSIAAAAAKDAANLDAQKLGVTSTTDNSNNPTYVTVTATYAFTTLTN